MSYNITIVDNITGVGSVLGFLNVNAHGLYFVGFILALIAIISMLAMRNNMKEFKALFFAFTITLIPTITLSVMEVFGETLIPPWYIALHISLLAITGVFAYMNK